MVSGVRRRSLTQDRLSKNNKIDSENSSQTKYEAGNHLISHRRQAREQIW